MIALPPQITDSFVPITAGLIVSLITQYIVHNPKFDSWCETPEFNNFDSEDDSNDTTKADLSDILSKASSATTATLPTAHPATLRIIFLLHPVLN
jgi:hypothetical protein